MRTIYAEYNINHDSIDVYTSAGYSTYVNLGLGSHFYRNVEAAHYMKLSPRIALGVAAFYDPFN